MLTVPSAGTQAQEAPAAHGALSAPGGASLASTEAGSAVASAATAMPDGHTVEIVGFALQGPQSWQQVNVPAMDVLVTQDGKRLVPLYSLLSALKVEKAGTAKSITFHPEGGPPVTVDLEKRELRVNGTSRPVHFVQATSEVTLRPELYLPPEDLSQALAMKIAWDQELYGFQARTHIRLKVWELPEGSSLAGIQTTEQILALPELMGEATPAPNSLDFLQLRLQARIDTLEAGQGVRMTVPLPLETLWGSLAGGQYRLELTQPAIYWDRADGMHRSEGQSSVMANWGQWNYRLRDSEVTLGDSHFGLNGLTFPIVRMSGIRVNGLTGLTDQEAANDRSGLGSRSVFVMPYTFQIEAPLGAKVELYVNDRRVDTAPEFVSTLSPGVGLYRFENIRLPPGTLNNVRLRVTDENGQETETRIVQMGSTELLPKGRTAYVGGLGQARDINRWRTDGVFLGGRALHGLTDRLTIGATAAYQQRLFRRPDSGGSSDDRYYPRESMHLGAQAAWQALDRLMITGDFAAVSGFGYEDYRNQGSFSDSAYRFHGDWYPVDTLQLYADTFRYGAEFFNGSNLNVSDRQGYYAGGSWRPNRTWTAQATAGRVWNDVDGQDDNRLIVDFQSAELVSRLIPRTTVSLEADRMAPQDLEPQVMYTVRVVASIFSKMQFQGQYSAGDTLVVEDSPDFFSGIPLPGLTLLREPSRSLSLTRSFNSEHSAGLRYWKSPSRERVTAEHSYRSGGQKKLLVRTELGQETFTPVDNSDQPSETYPFFENRTELTLDEAGTKRLGLQTRLDRDQWRAMLYFDLTDTFAVDHGRAKRLVGHRIQPEVGAVHGRVFLDYNANGIMDLGEPGLEGIRVRGGGQHSALTDEDGYYILPGLARSNKLRVSLDIDTVSAVHHPTHGTQEAQVKTGSLTEVNLGVAPAIIVTGYVLARGPMAESIPVAGVRVLILDKATGKPKGDSVTASDGSYYLQNLLPGKYILQIDPVTLPGKYLLGEHIREIELLPVRDSEEVEMMPFDAVVRDTGGKDEARPRIVLGAKTSDVGDSERSAKTPEMALPPQTPGVRSPLEGK